MVQFDEKLRRELAEQLENGGETLTALESLSGATEKLTFLIMAETISGSIPLLISDDLTDAIRFACSVSKFTVPTIAAQLDFSKVEPFSVVMLAFRGGLPVGRVLQVRGLDNRDKMSREQLESVVQSAQASLLESERIPGIAWDDEDFDQHLQSLAKLDPAYDRVINWRRDDGKSN